MFQLSLTTYGQSQISSAVYIDGVALVAAHIDNISSLENLSSLTTVFDSESAGNFNGSSVNIRINDLSSSAYQACTILLYQDSGNNKKIVAGYSHSSAIVSKTATQELNLFLSFDASCFTNGCMLSSIQVTPATASLNADGIVHIENESTSADDTYSVYSKSQIDSILESSIPTVNNAKLTIKKNSSDTGTEFTANASTDVTCNLGLAAVATSGSYNDLINKPTIPTVNNSTITIKKNSDDTGDSFTTNASSGKTINLGLSTVASSGSYNDLSNKPTIPTVNNASLTINKGGTDDTGSKTFTANASSNVTINLGLADVASSGSYNDLDDKPTIPTVNDTTITIKKNTSDTGDSFTTNTSTAKTIDLGLATVATSGSYTDLSNKPTIPTVNNATLTIQKNGSTVNTFTANASSDVTANITVPLESVSVNGTSQTITNRNVDIHVPADLTGSELIGGFVRYNVSGSGNLTISNTYGLFPHSNGTTTTLPAGTYLVRVRLRSTTSSYSVTVNFGTPYTISTSNGVIDDLRSVTLSSAQGFSASITQVNANTYIRVVLYEPGEIVTSVGAAAVTNDYNDLDNIPNGTLIIQKNGSNIASFSSSANSNVTANISVPTTVASLSDASNYVTTNTAQTITGEKTFEDVVFHVDNAASDSDLVLDFYHYDDDGTDAESSELTLRPVSDDFGNLGDYAHRYYNIWADNFYGTLHGNASSASTLLNTRYIDGVGFNGSSNIAHYGECSTGASTQIKDVTIPNFNLVTGARVIVKFTNTNSASNPQLRVNTSGTNGTAKPIMYRGSSAVTTSSYYKWQAGSVIEFIYDGTNWVWAGFQEYVYYSYSSTYSSYLASGGTYVAAGYYSNPTRAIVPYNSVATSDLGTASNRWRTLYLSTSISDGTNIYSLPSSTGTLALTSDIPEEIFCEAEVAYGITITSNCDFRLQAPSTSNNPRWRGNGTSLTVTQYVNLTNNLRLSVYVPTKASVASIAFKTTSSSSTYSVYPIYFRGDDSEHNAFIPEGSILRLTFKSNAFYTDFYDLADFGVEHEPIVRVGKVPYNSNDYYNYAGTLVGVRRDNGKFDQLLTVTKSGTVIDDNIIDLADGSPIYVSFQGECFSAHPRVPFGFILNLEYIYSAGQTPNASNVPFRFVTSDGTTIADHIVANTSGEHSYRYFHIDNAPVYLLNYQSRSFNIGGGTDDHLISIGGIPSNVGSMITGRLIGYLCEGAENAGLIRLVQSTSNDNVTLHTNQRITGSKTFVSSQSFLSDINLGSYTKLSTSTGGTSIYKTFNTILSTTYNDLEKFNITTTTALRNLSSSGYPLSSVRTLPSVNNVWSIGNEYYRLNSITSDKIALCEDSSLCSTFVVEPDLITLIERGTEIGDVTNAKISFKTLNYYGHSPSNTDGIPTGRVEFSFSAIRSDDSSNVATNSFYIDLDSIYPSVNESMSLGNFANHWKYIYADTISVDSDIVIDGSSLNDVITGTTVANATSASNILMQTSSTNSDYPLVFSSSIGSSPATARTLYTDSVNNLMYNPSKNLVSIVGRWDTGSGILFKYDTSSTVSTYISERDSNTKPGLVYDFKVGTDVVARIITDATVNSSNTLTEFATYPVFGANLWTLGKSNNKLLSVYTTNVYADYLGSTSSYISSAYINNISTSKISDATNRHDMLDISCTYTSSTSTYASVISPCDNVFTYSNRTCNLGTVQKPFNDIFTKKVSFAYYAATNGTFGSNSLYSGTYGIHCSGSLCPDSDNGTYLGNGQCKWSNLYSYYVGNSSYPTNYGYFNYLYARNTLYVYNSATSSYLSLSNWLATTLLSEQLGAVQLLLVYVTNNTSSTKSISRGSLLDSNSDLVIGNIFIASIHQDAWTDSTPSAFDYVLSCGYSTSLGSSVAGVYKLLSSIYLNNNLSKYFLVLAVRVG